MRGDRLLHPDVSGDQRVVEEVAADLIGRIGEVRGEQQARRADAVGREDDDVRRLKMALSGNAVEVEGAGRTAVASGLDPHHPRIGPKRSAR